MKTGQDGALALGMAKHIVEKGLYDKILVKKQGFDEFKKYLEKKVTVKWAARHRACLKTIRMIAEDFAKTNPATIWIGYGMQRTNGQRPSVR